MFAAISRPENETETTLSRSILFARAFSVDQRFQIFKREDLFLLISSRTIVQGGLLKN